MNGKDNGTRDFSVMPENKPQQPLDFRKIVSISIFAVAIIVVLLFCAAIIAEIACKVSSGNDGDKTSISRNVEIKFENDLLAKSEITSGVLQLATQDHPANLSSEEIEKLEKLYSTPSRKSDSIEYYTTAGTPQSDRLTLETAENLGALTKALYESLHFNSVTVKYAYFVPKSTGTESYDFPHALGTTVDLCLSIDGDSYPLSQKPEILQWINENCYRFGFINSDPSGEVHDKGAKVQTTQLRYVGIPHATYIMQKDISFETYIEYIKGHYNSNNVLTILGADNKAYAVYYVAVDGVNTVKLPSNFEYTISGNNDGGIIVTVNLSKAK